MHEIRLLAFGALLAIGINTISTAVSAQPAPLFRASCADIRAKVDALGWNGRDLITIQVEDKLTLAKATDAVVYLGMCDLPSLRVLCVTYELDRLKVGDTIILTGALIRPDANHVLLDPCLHHKIDRK